MATKILHLFNTVYQKNIWFFLNKSFSSVSSRIMPIIVSEGILSSFSCTTQSKLFFTSMKIMFAFHVMFSHKTEDNVTYSRLDSGLFSKHCSTIYVGETMSIFLCFMLNSQHCPPIYLLKKRYSTLHWNVSPYRCVGVFMHRLQTSYCSLAPQAVKDNYIYIYIYIYIYTSWCLSLVATKTSVTRVGIDPVSYFPYLEFVVFSLPRKVVQIEKYNGFLQRMNSDRILHSFNLIRDAVNHNASRADTITNGIPCRVSWQC